jgi:hypothetical protein
MTASGTVELDEDGSGATDSLLDIVRCDFDVSGGGVEKKGRKHPWPTEAIGD